MSQNPNNRNSLLLCFQEIIKMMPQAGDLNAFLSALENVEDPLELCLKLANKLRLAPESRGDVTIEELASFFGAPIFLQLNNGNWVLYLGIRKLLQGGVQQERYAVFDPLTKVQGKMLFLQKDQLLKSWSGKAVFIRNGLTLLGISTNFQLIVIGLIIIVAVSADQYATNRKAT